MKTSVLLTMPGLAAVAGTAVFLGQLEARAYPGDLHLARSPAPAAPAGFPGPCGGTPAPAAGPDLIVCRIGGSTGTDFQEHTTVGGISAYALGTTSCNNGDTLLFWIDNGPNDDQHPVIAQNLFRLANGRFEQLGMSWLKHGFCAADSQACSSCSPDADCDVLQIGCSDTYGSSINGNAIFLGPRSEVNPVSGAFPFPHGAPSGANAGRLHVALADLDPALNPGAKYFGESQYITPDDAGTANAHNNNTYREAVVGSFAGGIYDLSFTGPVIQQEPAINAWQAEDPAVRLTAIDVPSDGRFILGHRATDNGDGTWHYEYALLNMNSHRAGQSFTVPVGTGVRVSGNGFHDVDYHSGDGEGGVNFDGTDWSFAEGPGAVGWSTDPIAANVNGNALRWGSLYNFRFDADGPPESVTATIGLFRAGSPGEVTVTTIGPAGFVPCPWDCGDGDGTVGIVDFLALLGEWGSTGGPCDLGLGAPGAGIEEFLDLLGNWGPCP